MSTNPTSARHGGRAGWFRLATSFFALAAIEMLFGAARTFAGELPLVSEAPRQIGIVMALAAGVFTVAAVLASRQRLMSGAVILLAYALSAVALYVTTGTIQGPGLAAILGMLALAASAFRRRSDAAATPDIERAQSGDIG